METLLDYRQVFLDNILIFSSIKEYQDECLRLVL
jgi:hypothetical protein